MDLEKLLFRGSKVRLKTLKLGVQSKFIWYLELYISRITYPRKVVFYRLKLLQTCIRKNKIQYFKAISKYIIVAQKRKKKLLVEFFAFLNAYYPKTQLIKALNSRDSQRPYERLLKISKTRDLRELFLSENDFKTCSAVNFSKNI